MTASTFDTFPADKSPFDNSKLDVAQFDTLKHVKRLESAGFTREQAELQTEIAAEGLRATMQHYATTAEVTQFKSEMKGDFQALRVDFQELKHQMELMEKNVDNKISSLENRMQKELAPIRTQMAVIMWTQVLIVLTVVVPAVKQFLGL